MTEEETHFDARVLELVRKGDEEKVSLLKNLNKKILPSQLVRIQKNDKTVLSELFLPKWVKWSLLQSWASKYKLAGKGNECVLCSEKNELGIDFNNNFICENCFVRLKNLK